MRRCALAELAALFAAFAALFAAFAATCIGAVAMAGTLDSLDETTGVVVGVGVDAEVSKLCLHVGHVLFMRNQCVRLSALNI